MAQCYTYVFEDLDDWRVWGDAVAGFEIDCSGPLPGCALRIDLDQTNNPTWVIISNPRVQFCGSGGLLRLTLATSGCSVESITVFLELGYGFDGSCEGNECTAALAYHGIDEHPLTVYLDLPPLQEPCSIYIYRVELLSADNVYMHNCRPTLPWLSAVKWSGVDVDYEVNWNQVKYCKLIENYDALYVPRVDGMMIVTSDGYLVSHEPVSGVEVVATVVDNTIDVHVYEVGYDKQYMDLRIVNTLGSLALHINLPTQATLYPAFFLGLQGWEVLGGASVVVDGREVWSWNPLTENPFAPAEPPEPPGPLELPPGRHVVVNRYLYTWRRGELHVSMASEMYDLEIVLKMSNALKMAAARTINPYGSRVFNVNPFNVDLIYLDGRYYPKGTGGALRPVARLYRYCNRGGEPVLVMVHSLREGLKVVVAKIDADGYPVEVSAQDRPWALSPGECLVSSEPFRVGVIRLV